ncbi:ribonuclease HII [Candidatus Cyanaurora vandensis]|uniref:ribonuclease HII n=1 Tax=Candidatus Cyanaurora vandensis TaxID=2714958 RepID=UPI002580DB7F|nr:ribonuclease HII [Candidatus Cyanaurora vandensis]
MPSPTLEREQSLWQEGYTRLAAVDEVGRGPWAGPVVAVAVVLPSTVTMADLPGVRDSKQLTPRRRQELVPLIQSIALGYGVGLAEVAEIDRINIRQATHQAMVRALAGVMPVDHVLVDGLRVPELGEHQTWVVRGDGQCLAIACASVLAKVYRDQLMQGLAQEFPGYGWERNSGYGTRAHQQALRQFGVTPHHRHSFRPVRVALETVGRYDRPNIHSDHA